MPTSLPQTASMVGLHRPKGEPWFIDIILGSVTLLVIPPLLLIFAAAACFGHGEISSESIKAALTAIADANP